MNNDDLTADTQRLNRLADQISGDEGSDLNVLEALAAEVLQVSESLNRVLPTHLRD